MVVFHMEKKECAARRVGQNRKNPRFDTNGELTYGLCPCFIPLLNSSAKSRVLIFKVPQDVCTARNSLAKSNGMG